MPRDAVRAMRALRVGHRFAAGRRDPCPFAVDDEGGDEVDQRRSEEQEQEERVGPAVEHIAEDRQNELLCPSWNSVVEDEREREEVEEKEIRTENHLSDGAGAHVVVQRQIRMHRLN